MLDWAASGAMSLTGPPDGPPTASPAPVLQLLRAVTAQLARLTKETGHEVRADPAELLTSRAALAGFSRGGQVSAGGACYLLPAADGWAAITLSRPDDLAAVPAVLGLLGLDAAATGDESGAGDQCGAGDQGAARARARALLAVAARGTPASEFAAAAQLLGVPAAALPAGRPPAPRGARPTPGGPGPGRFTPGGPTPGSPTPGRALPDGPGPDCFTDGDPLAGAAGWPPWRTARLAPPSPAAALAGAVVADLSAMWAGPQCAQLLGLAGADVIKVESPARPDGARSGNREFFDWLHAGHRSLAADLTTREGRAVLAALLESADVVIEASRPRALAAAGLAPGMLRPRAGQVWLSITGYGQAVPERVAFGDDAAVAGGLVGWTGHGSAAEPVFCADAVADPLTGVCAARAVALSRARGGGEHIDLPMAAVAAAFAAAPGLGPHLVLPDGSVSCPRTGRTQAVLPPRRPAPPPGRAPGPGRAQAPELGADTAAVLGWLAGRLAC